MLIDSTLREGSQAYGVYFSEKDRQFIAALLFAVGVEEMEIGHAGQAGLESFLGWARNLAGATSLSLWCRCRVEDLEFAARLGLTRVNIGLPASDSHREKRLKLTRRELCDRLATVLDAAWDLGLGRVSVGLEDVSRADLDFSLELARLAASQGATRIRLADTVGVLSPAATAALVTTFTAGLGDSPAVELAVHCHNDFGMATANAVSALDAGAHYADVSVLGLGERAGIARLEELVAWRVLARGDVRYNTRVLARLCRATATAAGRTLPRDKAVAGPNVFAAESGLHVHALAADPSLFEPYLPEAVGAKRLLSLGAKSGSAAVAALLGMATDQTLVATLRSAASAYGRPLRLEECRALAASPLNREPVTKKEKSV